MRWASLPWRKLDRAPSMLPNQAMAWASHWASGAGPLLDLLPCHATVISTEREILWANRAFVQDFGQGIGRPCYEISKRRTTVCPECDLQRVFTQGTPATWEETVHSPSLGTIHAVVHAVLLGQETGGMRAALKIYTDITQLKRRERQLELSQREYRALFEGVPCYISLQDRDFNILKTNRLFERDFGRAQGRKCYQVYKDRKEKCEACPVERTFEDGQIHFSEETVRRRSGEPMEVVVYTAPIPDHLGQTFAVMEMSTEITGVKRLQRELAALGQAVAITAHSIKNILNGLEGGAYVVQSGLRRQDPSLAQKGWEMVREGVDMAGRLVQDILLISRGRTPEYRSVPPQELATQVYNLFEKRARDLGVEFRLKLPEPGLEPIQLDPKGIHTALANLVANALDACAAIRGTGPRVVELRVLELAEERAVAFRVEDNGPGVPSHLVSKLFREMVSSKGSAGTGLGLLVTHKILREHGGKVRYHPRAQGGSLFELVIPRQGCLGEQDEPQAPDAQTGRARAPTPKEEKTCSDPGAS